MVFLDSKSKDNKQLIVTCNCCCGQAFHVTKQIWEFDENGKKKINNEYYFSSHATKWDSEQDGIFRILWKRIKRMWFALRGKDYLYQDVVMTETEFNEFIDGLNKLKEN